MRGLILTIDIDETSSWPEKITAQNERYLNHIVAKAASEASPQKAKKLPRKMSAT